MELENILGELQRRFGFGNFEADSNDVYSLQINDKFILNLAKASDRLSFYLYSDIFNFNQDSSNKLVIFERLLGANLFGNETHGSFFAFDLSRATILLIKRFDTRLVDYPVFYEEFRDFINGLGYWDKVIEEKKLQSNKFSEKKEMLMDANKKV
jgi:hypothetical protein